LNSFARYRLSGWIETEVKTSGGGQGALLNLHNLQGVATPAVTGTSDWKQVEVEFDIEDQASVQVNCLLGGWGQATGKAWFDDVRVEKIGQREPPAPTITVDATKVGEPMSANIYSQFIEHLGRCIYGGIWAEMLEDRKFHFPITAEYRPYRSLTNSPYPVVGASPWQIVGEPAGVTMNTNRPFAGIRPKSGRAAVSASWTSA
jgi:alpha-N-arabinofuranosidase